MSAGQLTSAVASRQAAYEGRPVELSRREAGLLEALMRRAEGVVTGQSLEEALYDFNEPVTPNAVEVAVSRLRKRLDDAGANDMLHPVRGLGYILRAKRA